MEHDLGVCKHSCVCPHLETVSTEKGLGLVFWFCFFVCGYFLDKYCIFNTLIYAVLLFGISVLSSFHTNFVLYHVNYFKMQMVSHSSEILYMKHSSGVCSMRHELLGSIALICLEYQCWEMHHVKKGEAVRLNFLPLEDHWVMSLGALLQTHDHFCSLSICHKLFCRKECVAKRNRYV